MHLVPSISYFPGAFLARMSQSNKLPFGWFSLFFCVVSKCFMFSSLEIKLLELFLESYNMAEDEIESKRMYRALMMAAELLHWTYQAISSSAFNLSMQVLRFLTFIPCSSLLPLSASDSYRVELSACVRWKCTLCTSVHLYISSARPSVCWFCGRCRATRASCGKLDLTHT